jgi:hypothetical protein
VTGPHVCPFYFDDIDANRAQKRCDSEGRIWHCTGDRVRVTDPEDRGWWYHGRTSLSPDDFVLEQRVYTRLQSSKAFIRRTVDGRVALVGEGSVRSPVSSRVSTPSSRPASAGIRVIVRVSIDAKPCAGATGGCVADLRA